MSATTEEVLGHHMDAIVATDIDEIMADFADDAVRFHPDGTVEGKAAITEFVTSFVQILTPDFLANFVMGSQQISGEYAYITLTCPEDRYHPLSRFSD
jgi:ketosteroid isomerase-like protein